MIGKILRRQAYIFVVLLFTIIGIFLFAYKSKLVYAKPVEKIDELIGFETKATFAGYLNDTKGNVKEKDLGKVEMKKVVGKNLYNIYITYDGETKLIKDQEIPYVGKDGQNNPVYPDRIYGFYYTNTLNEIEITDVDKKEYIDKGAKTYPRIAYTIEKDVKAKELKNDFASGEISSFISWTFWNLRTGYNITQDKIKYWGYVSEEKVEKNYIRAEVYDLDKNEPTKAKKLKAFNNSDKSTYRDWERKSLQEDYDFWYKPVNTNIKDYYLNLATPYPISNLMSIAFKYDLEKISARKDPNNPDSEYLNPNVKDVLEKDKPYYRSAKESVTTNPPEYTEEFVSLSYAPLVDEGTKQYKNGQKIYVDKRSEAIWSIFTFRWGDIRDKLKQSKLGYEMSQAGFALVKQGERSILASKIHNMAIKQGKLSREVAQIEKVYADYDTKYRFMTSQHEEFVREQKRLNGTLNNLLDLGNYLYKEGFFKVFGYNNHYFKIYLNTLASYDYTGYRYSNLKVIEMEYQLFGRYHRVKSDHVDTDGVIDYTKDPEKWNLDPNYDANKKVLDETNKIVEDNTNEINKIEEQIKAREKKRKIRRIIFLVLGSGVALAAIPIILKIFFRRR